MDGTIKEVSKRISPKNQKEYTILRVQDKKSGLMGTIFGQPGVEYVEGQEVKLSIQLDYRYNWVVGLER